MPYLSPQVTIPDNEIIYCSACGNPCVGHYHTVNLEYRGYDHTAYYCTNCFEVITDYDYYLMQLDFEQAATYVLAAPVNMTAANRIAGATAHQRSNSCLEYFLSGSS